MPSFVRSKRVLVTLVIGFMAGCTTTATEPVGSATLARSDGSVTALPTRVTTSGVTGSAEALLSTLPIKGRAPMTGYDRSLFGDEWTDDNDTVDGHNGCDTRDDILRRDLVEVAVTAGGCEVLNGTLRDPYTNKSIAFVRGDATSPAVQIDHVVALGDAWQTGARQLDPGERVELANDPLELLAVDGPTNQAKGDGDAASWLPPAKSYRCAYVARQIAVKARYHLWVTSAEHDAMTRILQTCPGQPVPVDSSPTPLTGQETTRPTANAVCRPLSNAGNCYRPGQTCRKTDHGASGIDQDGEPITCQEANNWRWTRS